MCHYKVGFSWLAASPVTNTSTPVTASPLPLFNNICAVVINDLCCSLGLCTWHMTVLCRDIAIWCCCCWRCQCCACNIQHCCLAVSMMHCPPSSFCCSTPCQSGVFDLHAFTAVTVLAFCVHNVWCSLSHVRFEWYLLVFGGTRCHLC